MSVPSDYSLCPFFSFFYSLFPPFMDRYFGAKGSGLRLTPSSSSMMSFPMEASVVHLQLLVALTAHLLWALNLQTARKSKTLLSLKP